MEPLVLTEQACLLSLARDSIRAELSEQPFSLELSGYDHRLLTPLACFVTLHLRGKLRGCIGCLSTSQPLVQEVVRQACNAAFRDHRFSPLTQDEFTELKISISVLSESILLKVNSQQALLTKLRKGEDGLILQEGEKRATFLPSVWSEIPNKEEFVHNLKAKGGFAADYWSSELQCFTYQSQYFTE